jgi:hypothetical protein
LEVTNTGNQVDSYDLVVNNLNSADTATLDIYTITNLNPGAVANIQLSVADSTPGDYDVTVTATSQTNSSITDTTTGLIRTTIIQAVGSMSGTVTDGTNPVYNALVELRQGVSVVASTNTIVSGTYLFTNVDIGTYDVAVIKAGFNDNIQPDTINEASTTVHDVILMPAGFAGTISGSVRNATNAPITTGAIVRIRRSDTLETVQIVTSDGSGDYVINGLPPTVGFTYDLDVNPIPAPYTGVVPPTGLSLISGETKIDQNIYLI